MTSEAEQRPKLITRGYRPQTQELMGYRNSMNTADGCRQYTIHEIFRRIFKVIFN